ncbi:FecR family protein [Chitinophaga sp. CF118]|uniref:FecR family protein n=1 Tax=Chitinophaga sp. CF118 TaxID=1884367 RepID=UPI0008E3C76B|nr:FecR domain-containing protein [Chitinophaga sp. CF118]SFD47291.1 FecR family protein [Chitinophaga sp. CF118]
MEVRKLKQLFRRYLLGQAREKESGIIDHWYSSFDEDPPVTLSKAEEDRLRLEMWKQIQPQIVVAKSIYLYRAAAIAFLLAGAGLTLFLLKQQSVRPAYTEITTKAGERRTLHMKDGSTLIINAGSTIHIAANFTSERRLNIIDGEVFFEVKKDPRKPFIVESGPLLTTVLGTSFNVTAYKAMHNLSVGVVSGKVSVNANILIKDQALIYDKQTNTSTINSLDQNTLEWQNGKLLLNDASFDEMVIMMQKNFGITITANQLRVKTTRYTTELSTAMEPLKAVQVLAAIHQLKVKAVDRQILIYE